MQLPFQDLVATLYYTVFTGLAIMAPTLTDRFISVKRIMANPEVYSANIRRPMVRSHAGSGASCYRASFANGFLLDLCLRRSIQYNAVSFLERVVVALAHSVVSIVFLTDVMPLHVDRSPTSRWAFLCAIPQLLYVFCYLAFQPNNTDLWSFGSVIYTCIMIIISAILLIESTYVVAGKCNRSPAHGVLTNSALQNGSCDAQTH